jgi:hypothetical protein
MTMYQPGTTTLHMISDYSPSVVTLAFNVHGREGIEQRRGHEIKCSLRQMLRSLLNSLPWEVADLLAQDKDSVAVLMEWMALGEGPLRIESIISS